MDKVKLILEAAQKLLKVAEDLRALADSVQAVCSLVTDSLSGKKPEALPEPEAKTEPEIPLEKVRGVLADKSRSILACTDAGVAALMQEVPCVGLKAFYHLANGY